MREIKSQLKALIDSVENMEENAEGMLLGGFAFIGVGDTVNPLGHGNCNCDCSCDPSNDNCNCRCSANTTCKPTSKDQKGAGFTGFPF